MRKIIAIAAAALIGLPAVAAAQGLIGQCADCHTMHNSEQGAAVAQRMVGGVLVEGTDANPNLLKMDCLACHASGTSATSVKELTGGSMVPQVYHADFENDLAAGNFKHLSDGGDRKGHNIVDLFAADVDNLYAAPGHVHNATADFTAFTCAGARGCHGTRSQSMTQPQDVAGEITNKTPRTGLAAVSGAHHANYDGLKNALQNVRGAHSGAKVAAGYRFIPGLKGRGNMTDRWMNVDETSHNEYYGDAAAVSVGATDCLTCHIEGTGDVSLKMTLDSTLRVPNQSMSGFCITCHGNFHSSGTENGTSGAFLRHPSDYVIPDRGEYAGYTTYDVTAPVARPDLLAIADGKAVVPNQDMVMCLSCHQAHATPYDGMLRFDYEGMVAGGGEGVTPGVGCLACHTTKGVSKQQTP